MPATGNAIFLQGNHIIMDENLIAKAFAESGITTEIRCEEGFAISEMYGIPKRDLARYCTGTTR